MFLLHELYNNRKTPIIKGVLLMLLDLFFTFFKIGAVTFGGGYAMLPILQREVAENKKWSTEEELMDYFAIGQCTPGMIAVNVATFVGYKKKGFSGGLAATLGVITPSMLIISAIAVFLSSFAENPFVIHAFAGIRACVCILIFDTVIKLGRKSVTDKRTVLIFFTILIISLFSSLSPVFSVILSGIAGYIFMPAIEKKGKAEK